MTSTGETSTSEQESRSQSVIADLFIEALRQGQSFWFRVGSGSMLPLLKVGSEVYIEPAPASEIRLGEIAAFETAQGLMIHRIVSITGVVPVQPDRTAGEKAQGDNSPIRLLQMPDVVVRPSWIDEQAVVGRVVAFRDGNRHINLKHPVARKYGSVTAYVRYRLYMTENRLLKIVWRACSRLALTTGCRCIERCCAVICKQ